jgi:hypothetical protein
METKLKAAARRQTLVNFGESQNYGCEAAIQLFFKQLELSG